MQRRVKSGRVDGPSRPMHLPRLNWRHGLLFLLGIAAALTADFLFPYLSQSSASQPSTGGQTSVALAPWGQLECTTIKLERPDDSFPDVIPDPAPLCWYFENFSEQQVRSLIEEGEFTPEQKRVLLERSRWRPISKGWRISPPLEVVRDMNMEARKQIYAVLKQSPLNTYMQDPWHIEVEKLDEWLAESGLSWENQQLFRRVVFREGAWVYLYDGLLFEWLCRDPQQRIRVAKALTRTETLLMKLRITPQSDIDALLRYWGQAGRANAMRPLVEALREGPGGTTLSVSYFFPTFARMRLFTYPDIRRDPYYSRQDCIWTSLNFFSETPKPEYFKPEEVSSKLKAGYTPVNGDLTFGDLMVLQNEEEVVHMCIYVADDVVFTKNGTTGLAPWVLMKRAQMLKEYAAGQPLKLMVFRRKEIQEGAAARDGQGPASMTGNGRKNSWSRSTLNQL